MNYVEWLRVRNVLRVTAIVLGVLILVVLIARISLSRYMTYDAWIQHLQLEPGSKVSRSVLPDGTKRTVIDDPADETRVVLDDLGYGGRHIVISEPTSRSHEHTEHVNVGSINVSTSRNGRFTMTTIDTNSSVPLLFYMIFADVVALVIATCLGAPFARENDGHLEIALTKPASRVRLAAGIMFADAVGIVAASFMTIVTLYICQLLFESPRLDFSGINAQALAMGIALPLCWYAMLAAATASMRRGYGAVLGFAWPIAILVAVFGIIPWGNSLVGSAMHTVFWFLSRFDPLTYASMQVSRTGNEAMSPAQATFALRYTIELALFAVYAIAAVVQWRRVEA
jgi:hypothetical protein